jgi:hypothetical protein
MLIPRVKLHRRDNDITQIIRVCQQQLSSPRPPAPTTASTATAAGPAACTSRLIARPFARSLARTTNCAGCPVVSFWAFDVGYQSGVGCVLCSVERKSFKFQVELRCPRVPVNPAPKSIGLCFGFWFLGDSARGLDRGQGSKRSFLNPEMRGQQAEGNGFLKQAKGSTYFAFHIYWKCFKTFVSCRSWV